MAMTKIICVLSLHLYLYWTRGFLANKDLCFVMSWEQLAQGLWVPKWGIFQSLLCPQEILLLEFSMLFLSFLCLSCLVFSVVFFFIFRSFWGLSYKKFILYHWASDSLLGYLELPSIGSQFSHYQQPYDKLSMLVIVWYSPPPTANSWWSQWE